jgi:HK97 family phage portal protein
MGLFGRKKPPVVQEKALNSVDDRGWTRIFDWIPGAWQSHSSYDTGDSVVSYTPVFGCISLISGDIGKLRPTIEQKTAGVWVETELSASKVLLKPNNYQNHIQFKEWWMSSKLIHGNAYALKVRSGREIVRLYLLDPTTVTPLVSDSGEVFYRLNQDNLAGLMEGQVVVPASEIIHDRENCLYHPLVGLPPLYACTISGSMGLKMQNNAKYFFENGSSPGGILTAPGAIADDTALRLKTYFEENFTGTKAGKVAVAGDGLKYEPMRMTNVDAQMVEMFKLTAETVCTAFLVPAYMIGVGQTPTYNNVEALQQQYYSQCLQKRIEAMEACLYDGLEIPSGYRVQMDLDGLFRMDTSTLMDTLNKGVGGGMMAPDEARKRMNLPPVPGGKYPYLQQQNYSLEALAQRDASNPLAVTQPETSAAEPEDADMEEDDSEDVAKLMAMCMEKELNLEFA